MIVELSEQDIPEIMTLEKEAFSIEMQASELMYKKRFDLGHILLGLRLNNLKGIISFSYGMFDPKKPETIPGDFYTWSTQRVPPQFNTAFIYNLGLSPELRGTQAVRELIIKALERAETDGCFQLLGEGPIPSYAGNTDTQCIPDIKTALDSFALGGEMPSQSLLFKDPHLALYRRVCPCSVIRIIPNFLPEDVASGGFRAMLFRDLR
jgi:hypothetical protein